MNEIQSTDRKRFEVRVSDVVGIEKILGSAESHRGFKKLIVKGLRCLKIENTEEIRVIDFLTHKEVRISREQGGRIKAKLQEL